MPDSPRPGAGGAPPSAPPTVVKRGGFGAGFVGGLIGGALIALAAVVFFDELAGLLGAPVGDEQRAARDAQVEQRLGALETGLGEAETTGAAGLDELRQRVEALEAGIAAAADAEAAAPGGAADEATAGAITALQERLAALQERVQGLDAGAAAGQSELEQRVGSLEQAVAETRDALAARPEPDLGPLNARLSELAAQLETTRAEVQRGAEATTADVQALRDQLGGLREQVNALTERTAQLPDLATNLTNLSDRVEQLNTALATLTQLAASNSERLDADERRTRHALALALAAARVQEALRRSDPFPGVIDVLAPVAETDEAVAEATETLRAVAPQGLPTAAELRESFPAQEIVRRARDGADDDTLLDEAADNVLGLVSVRRRGERAEGQGVEAVVARAEAELAQGDLAGAVQELQELSGAPAEAAAGWLARARARLEAETAAARLEARANELLGASL